MSNETNEPSTVSRTVDGMPHSLTSAIGEGMRYRFDLDKSEYRVRIPLDEESESRVVVYIEAV